MDFVDSFRRILQSLVLILIISMMGVLGYVAIAGVPTTPAQCWISFADIPLQKSEVNLPISH